MKLKFPTLLTIIFIFGLSQIAQAQVEKKFDEFDESTLYSVKNMSVGGFEFQAYIASGPHIGPFFYLLFMKRTTTWEYLRCHDLALLADGNPVKADKINHDGDPGGGGILESIMAFMNTDTFAALANSKTLRGKICNDVFDFSPEQIKNLKALGIAAGVIK